LRGRNTDPCLGKSKLGIRSADRDITAAGHAEPTRHGRTLDDGDGHHGQPVEGVEQPPDGLTHGNHVVVGRGGHRFESFEVTACAKEAATTTQGQTSDGAVVLQGIANTLQVGDDLVSEWVATLWLIEPDGEPALVEFAFDRIGMG
jgi:hypothetical protein